MSDEIVSHEGMLAASSTSRKQRTDYYTLPLEEQRKLRDKEEIIRVYLKLREQQGDRVPRHAREAAASQLNVSVWRINQLAVGYMEFRQDHPDRPGAEFFIPRPPGRTSGVQLNETEKRAIRLGIQDRLRTAIYSDGSEQEVRLPEGLDILDVFQYARALVPDIKLHTVRRYIKELSQDKPALMKLVTEGELAIRRDLLPKKSSDADRPDLRWQTDGRDLPFYIVHNGEICTAVLVSMFDEYSRHIVGWVVVPKKEKDPSGTVYGVNFTMGHVGLLYASSMYSAKRRPYSFYHDHGSQFVAVVRFLRLLTLDSEPPLEAVLSRAGEPWGRGICENHQGQFNRFLKRYPGFYDKHNRMSIRKAQQLANLLTTEQLEQEFFEYFPNLNREPGKKLPSRAERWSSAVPLPAPPIRHLAHLPLLQPAIQNTVKISHWGFSFGNGTYFEPKVEGRSDRGRIYRLWMDAADANDNLPLYAIRLTVGLRMEICLRGEWIEAVPKGQQELTVEEHARAKEAAIHDLKHESRKMHEADRTQALQLYGTLPKRRNTTVAGSYTLTNDKAQPTITTVEQHTETLIENTVDSKDMTGASSASGSTGNVSNGPQNHRSNKSRADKRLSNAKASSEAANASEHKGSDDDLPSLREAWDKWSR